MSVKSIKSDNIYRGLIAALERKDQALKTYSNITSHELRAPIASMLGLMQLWKVHKDDLEFSCSLIEKMEQCAIELDQVACKLNSELNPSINCSTLEKETYRY